MVSRMQQFDEHQFQAKLDSALKSIGSILDQTRTPTCAAEDVDHAYDDKFLLADYLTNVCISSTLQVLEMLGLDAEKLKNIQQIYKEDKRAVTLRFAANETCEFLTEKKVEVDGSKQVVLTSSNDTIRCKVKNTVTEYHWKFGLDYSLFVYVGNDPESSSKNLLQGRKCQCNIITQGNKKSPRPASSTCEPIDIQITWLIEHLNGQKCFCIDRSVDTCHTPRRNNDIDAASDFVNSIMVWGNSIHSYFVHRLAGGTVYQNEVASSITPHTHSDLAAINVRKVFVPVLPLFHQNGDSSSSEEGEEESLLTTTEVDLLLDEMDRSMKEKVKVLTTSFPAAEGTDLISVAEAKLSIAALLLVEVSKYYQSSIAYIESMLRNQLARAIGKEIGPSDFEQFSHFQCCKIFKKEYAPQSLCYAIRRPGHYPDGTLSIETDAESSESGSVDPISVLTREIDNGHYPMYFPINAATTVEFTGKKYIHSWLLHSFSSKQNTSFTSRNDKSYKISARARQFSCFMLMIGKITAADTFQPEHAIILKNKDEVLIPLLLECIPTAKEFKDAIQSLSPEQKQFASAFRQMQLETSVFAMCVVQLKPQLELLLGLPQHSLTKEIQLTQDLLSLFIDYQIPSDLLTFDGDESSSTSEKISAVKGHVKAVLDTIAKMKEQEVKDAEQAADMRFETYSHVSGMSQPMPCPPPEPRSMFRSMSHRARGRSTQESEVQLCAYSAPPRKLKNLAPSEEMLERETIQYDSAVSEARQEKYYEPSSDQNSYSIPGTKEDLSTASSTSLDLTQMPKELDKRFEIFDIESALKSTKIKTSPTWIRKSSKNSLLLSPKSEILTPDELKSEKAKALDLLDALSRSGSLPIACADLHVILATTHCFDKSLISTIIEENCNPMEKIETSLLIIGSTIFGANAKNLLKNDDDVVTKRIATHSPALLED